MGNNGNVLEHYYGKRNKDWSLIFAGCTLILALITIIYLASEKITDLKIEISKRDTKIFILEQQKRMRIVTPD